LLGQGLYERKLWKIHRKKRTFDMLLLRAVAILVEKIRPNEIDSIICAEILYLKIDPELYEIVSTNMIHGPRGNNNRESPCMIQTLMLPGFFQGRGLGRTINMGQKNYRNENIYWQINLNISQ